MASTFEICISALSNTRWFVLRDLWYRQVKYMICIDQLADVNGIIDTWNIKVLPICDYPYSANLKIQDIISDCCSIDFVRDEKSNAWNLVNLKQHKKDGFCIKIRRVLEVPEKIQLCC
jgi:hypothetical protein